MRPIFLHIDEKLCRTCSRCLAAGVCTVRAIVRIDPGETPYIDFTRCYDCRLCLPACPFGAITIRRPNAAPPPP